MKKKIFSFILLCLMSKLNVLNAQEGGMYTPDAVLDTVRDMLGNKVSLHQINPNRYLPNTSIQTGSLLCTAGYFDLYFEPGCGMENTSDAQHNARRQVLCQVFTDISNFITSPLTGTNTVRIGIKDISTIIPNPSSSGALGAAGAYFVVPTASFLGGIGDNEIWKTINSGIDSYKGVASPLNSTSTLFYHGYVYLNFANLGISWNTSLTTGPLSGQVDLYTVCLHEVTHALGFYSAVLFDGSSRIGLPYYTRYDTHLFTPSPSNAPLVTNTGSCSAYSYSFNPALTASVVTSPGSFSCSPFPSTGSSDFTSCNSAVRYIGSAINQPVYTPNCFEPPSSLSHFEDMCQVPGSFSLTPPASNNMYFVMSNATGLGVAKRVLTPEERSVLCDIGYGCKTNFGVSGNFQHPFTYTGTACSPYSVVGNNDGINSGGFYTYQTPTGTGVSINPLTNDYGVSGGSFQCVQIVYGSGTISNTSGTTSFTYTPSVAGLHLLRYYPQNGGVSGNITYIYVWAGAAGCTPSACNIINNGGFENSTGCGIYSGAIPPYNINCWSPVVATPDFYTRTCAAPSASIPLNVPPIPIDTWSGPSSGNDKFSSILAAALVGGSGEGMIGTLSTNLIPGQTYKFGAWFYYQNPSSNSPDCNKTLIQVATSTAAVAPIVASSALPSAFTPLTTLTITPKNQWNYITGVYTYTGTSPATHICFFNPQNINYPNLCTIQLGGLFFDDVSLLPASSAPTFTLPPQMCAGTIPNLAVYATPPGGAFSGPGVSFSGGLYSFTSSTLGLNTIVYSYTNSLGCVIKTPAQINIITSPTVTVTPSSSTLCPAPNATLTASGSNYYLWQPGSLSGSPIVVTPSISTIYTVSAGLNCTNTATTSVTVNGPTVTVLPNPGSICPGTSSITYTATGATSYTWASSTQTVIGNPATLSPTATTIYTVTGSNGTCTNYALQSVFVNTTCICSFDPDISYLFPSSITIVGSSHSGAGLPRYSINNNITVTGNVGFYSAEFAIAPNVSITVASGGTLTINKCHLYACNNMWQGIVVQNGGYLIIESDALIEDAIEAVSINSNTNTTGKILTVNTAIFNNNYKAISVSTYTQAITNYPFEIVNSIFTGRQFTVSGMSWPTVATLKSTCSSTNILASPYCLQNAPAVNLKAPNNTTSARFGVYLNNIGQTINPTSVTPTYYDIVIGDYLTQGNFNIFDNLYFGIYGIDANVQCYNNVLQNTRYTGSKGNFTGGMGISLNSSTLNINSRALLTPPAPYHLTRKNKFYNCTYGLLAGNYFEMKADYMEFRSTQTASGPYQQGKIGIYLVTNRFKKYDVNNNLIYNIENGIIFNTTYGPIKFGATTFTNTQYAGPVNIFANSISPVSSGSITTEFVSNAISTQNILSAGSTQTVLAGAVINENGNAITNAYKGIYGSDFNNPKVISQSNYITLKANPAGGSQYGIKLVAGTSPTITLNNISGASGLATNTLVTCVQTEQNNAPSVTCNTVSSTGQGFEFSKSQPNSIWKGNSMTNHSRGMVLNYTATIGQQGSAGNPIDNTWNGSWPFGTYNTWTDNGTFASSTNTLYVKNTGVYYPSINSGFPTFNSYQSCCIFTTTGTYFCGGGGGGSMMMSSSSTSSSGNTQTLDKISQDNSDFIAQYQLYRYLKENPSIKNSSIKLSAFYSSNNNSAFGKLSDIEEELAKGNYSVATGKINTLNATNSIINNYKSFFNIYLSFVYNTINLNEINDLESLANKCPFTEGAVVYKARSLYNIVNKIFLTFNDNCPVETFENARFNTHLNNENQQWQASIFPNPASEEINISCSENENLNLEIRDVTGKVVLKKVIVIENNLHQLKVDLKSGIYFVNLMNTNGQQFAQKLIITK